MTDDHEPNPYQPTVAEPADQQDPPIDSRTINYPGGLGTILAWGVSCGILVGGMIVNQSEAAVFVPLVFWCGSFAALGLLLPGSVPRRLLRALIAFVLSFPALVLYVPVCGFTLLVMDGNGSGTNTGMMIGSIVAFSSVLFLAAILVRMNARLAHRVVPNRAPAEAEMDESDGDGDE